MAMALLNRFISSEYRLNRLKTVLEVPLDSTVQKRLMAWGKQQNLIDPGNFPPFRIRALDKEHSDRYQELAQQMAESLKIPRGFLDIVLWGKR